MKCTGCDKEASQFQCPLCQAEEAADEGFFCSQECFSKNWILHRDGAHKGGTVKAGAKRKRDKDVTVKPVAEQTAEGKKKGSRPSQEAAAPPTKDVEVAKVTGVTQCPSWKTLPDPQDCDDQKWATVKPVLALSTARAVVLLPDSDIKKSFWSAAHVATQFIVKSVAKSKTQQFVVVGGSPITVHAFAWALRSANLMAVTKLVLSTSDEDLKVEPSTHFSGETRVIVISSAVLTAHGKKVGANVSQWMDNRTLITLPDVSSADELQTMNSKAIFLVGDVDSKESPFSKDDVSHRMEQLIPMEFLTPVAVSDLGTRFDNELSTCIASGFLMTFLDGVIRMFSNRKSRCEEILTNTLFVDWGCAQSDLVAHHKLAYIMRYLADHSDKFASSSLDLVQIAVRTICRVARYLPAVDVAQTTSATRNITLQATVCYMYPSLSPTMVDSFGESWGFTKVIEGPAVLAEASKIRSDAVSRISHRYGAKLGQKYAEFLVIVMHLIYDVVSSWSLSMEEVDAATSFSSSLAQDVGPLDTFLRVCDLYGHAESKSQALSLISRHEEKRRREQGKAIQSDLRGLVHPPNRDSMTTLAFSTLPISGRRKREVDRLRSMAVDEILMAMPRQPIPMYIGDVGNLIGIWTKFNARFDAALGYTLSQFLESCPQYFRVVGNIVTRLKAGSGEQVRIRYDNEREDDSDDEDNHARKRRDRDALTGMKKKGKEPVLKKSAKARKRAARKEQNAIRYNRNRLVFDQEKKVPGYVKHGPRKIKGRGKKANIRNFKRAE